MNQNTSNFLEVAPIRKLMKQFSIPSITALLVASLYNMVDQIFIGHGIGYLGNGATNIVFPITVIAMAIAMMIGDGCAAFMSICQGSQDEESSHKAVGNALLAVLGSSIVLTILLFAFKEQILWGFGATENTIGYAQEYFDCILMGIPFYMFGSAMSSIIRADGKPGFSLLCALVGCILNVILDPIAIFVLDWGMMGAAVATVVGQIATAAIAVWYLFHTNTFKLKTSSFKPRGYFLGKVLPLGFSSFLTQASIVVVMAVTNNVLVKYGAMSKYGADIPLTVIGIVMKVFSIVTAFCIGTAVGVQPIAGYNFGAKRIDRVKESFKMMVVAEIIIGLVALGLFQLFPLQIVQIFGKGDVLYNEFAILTMRIYLAGITLCCVQKGCSIFLQAIGKPVLSAIISLLREIVFYIPLVLLLPIGFDLAGALYACPIGDVCAIIITALIMAGVMRKMSNRDVSVATSTAAIQPSKKGVIVTIAREHGSSGKEIGKRIASQLNIPFYYKEVAASAAVESGLHEAFITDINKNTSDIMGELYLSTTVIQQAVVAQDQIIRKIADHGSCVIVGRAADYVLRDYEDVVRIFIYAPKDYRMNKVMRIYGDTSEEAERNTHRSDIARATYYHGISGQTWGDVHNYDLMVDSSIGVDACAGLVCNYITYRKQAIPRLSEARRTDSKRYGIS